jgi:uncharacterized membrane protein YfcA
MWEVLFVLFVLFIGSFIQGSSGFGFGLFSMGLMSIFLTVKDSTLIILALTLVISSGILVKLWRYILWRDILPILTSAVIGRIIAFIFMIYFGEADIMKKWLGLVLIGMVIYLYIKDKSSKEINLSGKHIIPIMVGLIGGFIGGAFAIGGPFYVVYFLMRYEDKRHYNANLQSTFILLNGFTILTHAFHGDLSQTFIFYMIAGSLVVWFGVNQGLRWFDRMPREMIQKVAYLIVLLAGINLFIFTAF